MQNFPKQQRAACRLTMCLKYLVQHTVSMLCAAILALPASAQGILYHWTGNDLLQNLNGDPVVQIKARTYVSGVMDTLQSLQGVGILPRAICATTAMTDYQFSDVAKQYLVNHPQARHAIAANLVHLAMVEAFPCGK